jgi:hypothetical protein
MGEQWEYCYVRRLGNDASVWYLATDTTEQVEYDRHDPRDLLARIITRLGEAGWEMVTVDEAAAPAFAYWFKRRKVTHRFPAGIPAWQVFRLKGTAIRARIPAKSAKLHLEYLPILRPKMAPREISVTTPDAQSVTD